MTGRKTLRVAALMTTRILSGPGRQLAALAVALARREVEVHVLLLEREQDRISPLASHLEELGVGWTALPDPSPFDPSTVQRVAQFLESWKPDVVQTHGYKPTAVAAALTFLRKRPWPWVGFFHGATHENLKVRLYHALDLRLLRFADRVVVMSREQAGLFGNRPTEPEIIWNAVLPEFQIDSDRHPGARCGSGPKRLGVIGRLSPEKGVDVFLEALALVPEEVLFHALIAGEGPARDSLVRKTEELGLEKKVSFLGQVTEVRKLYGELDLLVIPSRSEGLPNVFMEALASDVPVVATRVGAIPEVIGGTAAAALVAPESPLELAEAIVAVLGNGRQDGPRAARRAVVRAFSLESRTERHLELYRSLLRS